MQAPRRRGGSGDHTDGATSPYMMSSAQGTMSTIDFIEALRMTAPTLSQQDFGVTIERTDTESTITFRDPRDNTVHLVVIGEREVSLSSGIESVFSLQARLVMRDLVALDAACRPLLAEAMSLMGPAFVLIALAVVGAFVCAIVGGGLNDIVLVNTSTILLWIALLLLCLAWHPATTSPPLVDMLQLKNLAVSASGGQLHSYVLLGPVGWVGYFFRAPVRKNIPRRQAVLRHIAIATLAVLLVVCAGIGSSIMNLSSKNRPVVSSAFGEHLTCSNTTDGYEFVPVTEVLDTNATIVVTNLCSSYYNMKDLFLSFWTIQILSTIAALATLGVVLGTEPRHEFKMETQARLANCMVLSLHFQKRATPSPWYTVWYPSSVHSLDILLPATSSLEIFDKINKIRQEFAFWKNRYGPTEDELAERIRRDEVSVRIAETLREMTAANAVRELPSQAFRWLAAVYKEGITHPYSLSTYRTAVLAVLILAYLLSPIVLIVLLLT